jgi:hypothetical protein
VLMNGSCAVRPPAPRSTDALAHRLPVNEVRSDCWYSKCLGPLQVVLQVSKSVPCRAWNERLDAPRRRDIPVAPRSIEIFEWRSVAARASCEERFVDFKRYVSRVNKQISACRSFLNKTARRRPPILSGQDFFAIARKNDRGLVSKSDSRNRAAAGKAVSTATPAIRPLAPSSRMAPRPRLPFQRWPRYIAAPAPPLLRGYLLQPSQRRTAPQTPTALFHRAVDGRPGLLRRFQNRSRQLGWP